MQPFTFCRPRFRWQRRVFHRSHHGRDQNQSVAGSRGKIHVQTFGGGDGQRTSAQTDDSHAQGRGARLERQSTHVHQFQSRVSGTESFSIPFHCKKIKINNMLCVLLDKFGSRPYSMLMCIIYGGQIRIRPAANSLHARATRRCSSCCIKINKTEFLPHTMPPSFR